MAQTAFDRWRRDASTFTYRGHDISYRVEGSGPTLLAIHGFPSASWDWWPIWPSLTARFTVVAADMIGFGWSAKPRDHDYSIMDQADLHEALLAELGISRVHVLAHDYGDTVAQELLARHEERGDPRGLAIASICFLNGGLFAEAHRPRLIQRVLASPIGPLIAAMASRRMFRRGLESVFGPSTPPSPTLVDELWTLVRHRDGHRVLPPLLGYMAERRRHRARWVGAIVETRVPQTLVDGALDPVSGAHLATRYRELVGAPTVLLEHVGHYPQIEDPEAVLAAFLAFHDRIGTAS
jgi:pimeloyl-ACP methyl ester carboxylesterase